MVLKEQWNFMKTVEMKTKILQLKNSFKKNKITKSNYINEMHNYHKILTIYPSLIENTEVKNILIDDKKVLICLNNDLVFELDEFDKRYIPIEIINFGVFEKNERPFFDFISKRSKVIFDIGANIGFYSLFFSKSTFKNKIYAFEPVKRTFEKLTNHIKINKCNNIYPYNLALSDVETKKNIFYSISESGSSSFKNIKNEKKIQKELVSLISLDKFCKDKKIKKIDFIKCDVEGYELFVLKGSVYTLRKFKPVVFCELLRKWSKKFNYSVNDVVNFFSNINFNCYKIKNKKLVSVKTITDKTINTNFIFIHTDLSKNIVSMFNNEIN